MTMHKILVIDDEEANVRVLSTSLKLDGYTVFGALNGEEGLKSFEANRPDIVLTDIKMPGMDGLEVLRRIKEMAPEAEVIIITGHGDIDSAIDALQHGASDFINKPVRDEALTVALKRAEEKLAIRRQLKAYTEDLENMVQIATGEVKRKSNFQTRLIKSSHDAIVATDENWKIVIFNPEAEHLFARPRLEVIRRMDIRDLLPDDIMAKLKTPATPQAKTGKLPWQETHIKNCKGASIPVRFSGKILYEKGQMMGSVAFFQDLSEIKRLQNELVQSERLAAVGQTVAGLAHCIKNIMHGFKGGSYIMELGLDKNDSDKLKAGWQMVKRNIGRTSDLVLDLLSYSKERSPEYQSCLPNEIVKEVCESLTAIATENSISVNTELDPAIDEVAMDDKSVYRILLNLMTNAIDACRFDENDKKTWQVVLSTKREKENQIRFDVTDNGCGMDEDVKAKLFTSFFSTKGTAGTGLGLLVTRKLIEEHKGRISVASELGKGTTFTVHLPYLKLESK